MAKLIPLSDVIRERNYDMSGNSYDPTGETVYASDGERVGKVSGVLTEEGGKLRYLLVDVGGWFSSKQVAVPVGMARMENDAVYFDGLSKDQVKEMNAYQEGQDYGSEHQVADEQVLRGSTQALGTAAADVSGVAVGSAASASVGSSGQAGDYDYESRQGLFQTPTKLQLLEERLLVNKQRYVAGSVEVGKRVETHTENVGVDLQRDELVIERHAVTDARPVDGNVVLGADSQTIRVDLEAERADVSKQTFVTEEVQVGKRSETEQKTVTDTVGREVLEVTRTGEVEVQGGTDDLKRSNS